MKSLSRCAVYNTPGIAEREKREEERGECTLDGYDIGMAHGKGFVEVLYLYNMRDGYMAKNLPVLVIDAFMEFGGNKIKYLQEYVALEVDDVVRSWSLSG